MTDSGAEFESGSQHPLDVEPDEQVCDALRETLEYLVDENDLATVFWSLDKVYDEYGRGEMSDLISEFEEARE